MRIAVVHTYPIYHNQTDTDTWLQRRDYVRWIPGLLSRLGHDTELWAADHTSSRHMSEIDGLGTYPIRLFESVESSGKTKKHYSDELVTSAREFDADVYVLKGTDGGVGERLLRQYLIPENKPFAFIIGGEYYTRYVPKADFVFYETEEQRQMLRDPGWYVWRSSVPDDRLLRLPKSVDTDQFRPMPDVESEWDIVSVGRLIHRYKNYDPLGVLSEKFDVAVVGSGPAEDDLKTAHPEVDWIGSVPHSEVPKMLNRGRVFMHAGHRDYYPRVIAEAAACGIPILAFAHAIRTDVLPVGCGLRLHRKQYVAETESLLENEDLVRAMGKRARTHAVENLRRESLLDPLQEMIRQLGDDDGAGSNGHARAGAETSAS